MSHVGDSTCGILQGEAARGILRSNAYSVSLDTVAPLTNFACMVDGGGGADGTEGEGVEDATDSKGTDGISDGGPDGSERGGAAAATHGRGADGVSNGGPDESSGSASELPPTAC